MFLKNLENIQYGTLRFVTPEGELKYFKGKNEGITADITIKNWDVLGDFIIKGDIGIGEGYVGNQWDSKDLSKLLYFGLQNQNVFLNQRLFPRIVGRVHKWLNGNSQPQSKKNISKHYDVGNEFYQLWLDKSMTYSSALFGSFENRTLEEAQNAKYDRILNKIGNTRSKILDIGCGWGGFIERAVMKGHNVTGVTISAEQHDFACKRLHNAIEEKRASVLFKDYRDVQEQFDAVVSIGMFEHVGEEYWSTYMNKIRDCLKPQGKAVIQTIVVSEDRFDAYRNQTDFIRKHIFPGGMLPSVTRFKEEAMNAGLRCLDTFLFGQDYARTLDEWLKRFDANYDAIKAMGYDDSFIRKWRFYLAGCKSAFEIGNISVVQFELRH